MLHLLYSHGSSDGHMEASNRITLPRPQHRRSYKPGDGCPPDTAEALHASSSVAANHDTMSPEQQVPAIDEPLVGRAQLRQLQSYQMTGNSCYFDCGMELWFRAYLLWPPDNREAIVKLGVPNTSPLWTVLNHFRAHLLWILHPGERASKGQVGSNKKGKGKEIWPAPEDNLERGLDILSTGQTLIRNTLASKDAIYKSGTYGSTIRWMSDIILVCTKPSRHLRLY